MTKDEVNKYYIYEYRESSPSDPTLIYAVSDETPSWLKDFQFWTMSAADDENKVYNSSLYPQPISSINYIRPIVNISKEELVMNEGKTKEYTIEDKDFIDLSNNKYKTGDIIYYKGIKFYVLNSSKDDNNEIALVKVNPLTVDEVNEYGVGHINKYSSNPNVVTEKDNYGGVAYYTSESCNEIGFIVKKDGCTNNYDESDLKYIIDSWFKSIFDTDNKSFSNLNLSVRTINNKDLIDTLYYKTPSKPAGTGIDIFYEPSNIENMLDLSYCCTSIPHDDSDYYVKIGNSESIFFKEYVYDVNGLVCPVVTLKKNPLPDQPDDLDGDDVDNENNLIVKVSDTKLKKSILIATLGVIIIIGAFSIVYLVTRNKK